MATQKCKDCGNQISKRAKQCPHCGAPARKKTGCLGVIALLFLVAMFIGIISSSLNGGSSPSPAQPAAILETKPKPTDQTAQREPESAAQSEPTALDWQARQAELKEQYLQEFQPPQVGSRISLTLKSGSTREGVVKRVTESKIRLEIGSGMLGFTKSSLSTESRVRCFASDYATYNAYKQTKEEKDAFEARERARMAEIEAKRKATEDARLSAERKNRIESAFSIWHGSHRVNAYIKKSMHDPKSYEHVETIYIDKGDHLIVTTKFRGKNAFGALILNQLIAKTDLDGNVIEVIAQSP